MSDILTKKIYSKNKDTGVETQVYPETNPASVVGLGDYVDGRISTATASLTVPSSNVTGLENYVDGRIQAATLSLNNEGHLPLSNFDFSGDHSSYDGTYTVLSAVNSPFNEVPGVMTFSHAGNDIIETWHSASYVGYRKYGQFNPITAEIDVCTIDGVSVDTSTEGDVAGLTGVSVHFDNIYGKKGVKTVKSIHLESGSTHTISGVLTNTRIVFDQVAKNKTSTLTLNGLYIHFNDEVDLDNEDYGEDYAIASETMIDGTTKDGTGTIIINLAEGSKNYLFRDVITGVDVIDHPTGQISAQFINNSSSVIYNEGKGTLKIMGPGYLSIFTLLGGHAIKSKGTLVIDGEPVIRATAYHDILHGNVAVNFNSGHVYCDYCNDFFGTNTSGSDQKIGNINIYSGDFTIIKCEESFLQTDSGKVYPGVSVKYKDVGEGLWLQSKPGLVKLINGSGLVNKYYTIDYTTTHSFKLYTLTTPLNYFAEEATDANIVNQPKTESTDSSTEVYGLTVYDGVITTALDDSHYVESGRNDPRLTDPKTDATGITTEHTTAALAEPLAAQESFEYVGTVFGGPWTIGITTKGLADYKASMEYLLKNISTMIIPPKSVIIKSIQDYCDSANPGEIHEYVATAAIAKPDDPTKTAIDVGEYIYTSKQVNKYIEEYPEWVANNVSLNVTLHLGETVRLNAEIDPANVTNNDIKWTTVGLSETPVFSRIKEEDLRFCQVQGLAIGDEDLMVSTKALDKDYKQVAYTIHFHVVQSTISFEAGAYVDSQNSTSYAASGEMGSAHPGADLKYTLPECTFTAPAELAQLWPSTETGFTGWSINGGNEMLPAGTQITVRKDTVLTATWGPISPAEPQAVPGE